MTSIPHLVSAKTSSIHDRAHLQLEAETGNQVQHYQSSPSGSSIVHFD